MTLILACLTSNAVYQVSDRRLTDLDPPHKAVDDEANKAIVVGGRVVFGYTGLARIDRERTDLWLARILAGSNTDMAQVVERVRVAATDTFRKIRCDGRYKRQAFQGVGWFRLKGNSALTPGIVTIDNAIDHHTGRWLPAAKDEFGLKMHFPSDFPSGCVVASVGLSLSPYEKRVVIRLLRKCVRHRRSTPNTVVTGLVLSMRWLSAQYEPDSPIGPGLMVVCLPRLAAELSEKRGRGILLAGAPNEVAPTFLYVSANGSPTYFGPHFVMGRSSMVEIRASSS